MSDIRRLQPEARLSGAVVHGNTVYLADGTNGWLTLDVSNPAAPTVIRAWSQAASSARAPGAATSVAVTA